MVVETKGLAAAEVCWVSTAGQYEHSAQATYLESGIWTLSVSTIPSTQVIRRRADTVEMKLFLSCDGSISRRTQTVRRCQ